MTKQAAIVVITLLSSMSPVLAGEFDYIDSDRNSASTTHPLEYQIRIDDAFKPLGELHHRQASRDMMFNVSFAAYANEQDIILIHTETLENESGVLDYSDLPHTTLDGVDFRFREQCVPVEATESLQTNPEAVFVKEQGFDLVLPFLLTQFLMASADGNAELVISYGRRVGSCADIADDFNKETRARAEASIRIQGIN